MDTPTLSAPVDDLAGLTPRQIVAELDQYIVGQGDAKRSVAIALRNRWRRLHASAELRDEIGIEKGGHRKRVKSALQEAAGGGAV